MSEYISREELLEKEKHQEDWNMFLDYVTIDDVKSIPAADVRENIHAEWEDTADPIDSDYGKHFYQCPKCFREALYFVGGTEDWWCVEKPHFCPNCGADMRKPKTNDLSEIFVSVDSLSEADKEELKSWAINPKGEKGET